MKKWKGYGVKIRIYECTIHGTLLYRVETYHKKHLKQNVIKSAAIYMP